MKIYTKSGDEGHTGLFAGPRVSKDDARIEAYGTVDELNAALGVTRSQDVTPEIDRLLKDIQNELFAVGAELATPSPQEQGTHWIGEQQIAKLEEAIDGFESQLEPLTTFILPAGTAAAASLHLARAICRRAERRVVTLGASASISSAIIVYLNRLGDLLFVLSRASNSAAGTHDVVWTKPNESNEDDSSS